MKMPEVDDALEIALDLVMADLETVLDTRAKTQKLSVEKLRNGLLARMARNAKEGLR